MSIVRESKFRHVFGTPFKNEYCFLNLRAKTTAWDQNFVVASGQYIATPWNTAGGAIAILKHNEPGKKKPDIPCFTGHQGEIYDMDFNPFNENILASASFDGTVRIWGIPKDGLKETTKDALVVLDHDKKVGICKFHPTASNLLVTAPLSKEIKFWDIEKGEEKMSIQTDYLHPNAVDFNLNGSLFCTTAKDKKLRVYDPRGSSKQLVSEVEGHQGMKGARVSWLKKLDLIFTVGFTKISEREMKLYDPRKMEEPLTTQDIDSTSSILMPFYDEDTSIMYLAGKGDASIRYYEIDTKDSEYMHYITTFKSIEPQRGMGMVPKYALDVSQCEVTRLLKLTTNSLIPIMFQVPRKSLQFQNDIYPDTFSYEVPQTASDFLSGKDAEPKLIEMHPDKNPYKGKSFTVPSFQPTVTQKKKETKPKEEPIDPKKLVEENSSLKKRVAALEKENKDLKQEIEQLQDKISDLENQQQEQPQEPEQQEELQNEEQQEQQEQQEEQQEEQEELQEDQVQEDQEQQEQEEQDQNGENPQE